VNFNFSPMQPPPTITTAERKPHGFDSGLKCLTAVYLYTVVVRVVLNFIMDTQSIPIIQVALAGVLVGLTVLLLMTYIVWSRRHESPHPPRRWATMIAMAWVLEPNRFKMGDKMQSPSLRQLSKQLGFTAPNLSPFTADFSRLTKIFNQFQNHDWRKEKHEFTNN